jgi:hypothetical protein
MPIPVTSTINGTSFASAYMDATALVLDAISMIGMERKARLNRAKGRMGDAMMYADTMEEVNLVEALMEHVAREERAGRGV